MLNRAQRRNDLAIENLRDQEGALQSYIDRMTELMLEHGLGKLKPGHEIEQFLDQMTKLLFEGELDQSREASLRDELWSGLSGKLIVVTDVNFAGARLIGARLRGSNLFSAKLPGACLKKADLYGANLQGVTGRADLRQADLRDADLRGADLGKARLRGADLAGAIYNDKTVWPKRFTPPPGAIRAGPSNIHCT